MQKPDCVFEISWEVCNMVGGIHTVLESKAMQMREHFGDNYICVGPHVPHQLGTHPSFHEEIWDDSIYKIAQDFSSEGVTCRMGRWLIPGEPKVLLINFRELFRQKDRILSRYWEKYHLNSLFGGYDYVEPVLFSHAAALLIEQIYSHQFFPEGKKVLVHAHEWMCAASLLHLKDTAPEIATVFTTHATMLGRSLSSREGEKPLADFLAEKSPAEWATAVGIESKHSLESIAAAQADCFTTVSALTSEEVGLVLGKAADFVVHNGLSDKVPPQELLNPSSRAEMRKHLLRIAGETTGYEYNPDQTFIMVTSGRYEFKNKGIDIFLDAVLDLKARLSTIDQPKFRNRKILACVMCPAGHGPRGYPRSPDQFSAYQLTEPENDPVLRLLKAREHINSPDSPVHVIFIPTYLNGSDIPQTYIELLSGVDLAVFGSWYEPWGYTPHEAIALGVPTVTTNHAGFGLWARSMPAKDKNNGVVVIDRKGNYDQSRAALSQILHDFALMPNEEFKVWGKRAYELGEKARWKEWIQGYMKAYAFAVKKAEERVSQSPRSRFRSFSLGNYVAPSPFSHARANVRKFTVMTRLPAVRETLQKFMDEHISWHWDPRLVKLLSSVDPVLWEMVDQKPARFMDNLNPESLRKINHDPALRRLYEAIRWYADKEIVGKTGQECDFDRGYFCMEYGITDKLRIYSGGLGILAGDHLKTAADLQIPMAAFGLFFQYGYFSQSFDAYGNQLAHFHRSELENVKLNLVQDESGGRLLLSIPFAGEELFFQVWRLNLRSVGLFLLDSNVGENPSHLREITDRLYNADPSKRIAQEWLLSIGGLELIKKLNMKIKIFHLNEGHTAFLAAGRVLDLMQKSKLSYEEAFDYVRFSTIFTTHTPVAAGHDEFNMGDVVRLLKGITNDQVMVDRFLSLGTSLNGPGHENNFSMTALAIRGSSWVNAVSKIHKGVSQRMFNNIFPDLDETEVPITHVTNGVHVPYWLAPNWQHLFYETLGEDWPLKLTDATYWRGLERVPLERFHEVKLSLKRRLIDWIHRRLDRELHRGVNRPEYAEVLARLGPETLIVTHAKRMAPYKRADILFQDPDRLHDLIRNSPVPILFLYAGKSHPSDGMGKEVLQRIHQWSKDPRFMGSVLILENYDLSFAQRLLAGSDIWLNTPMRPLEASGTSGMKAAINGTMHFSVADGWWPEVYNGLNGWMLGTGEECWSKEMQDEYDRNRILHIFENELLREFAVGKNEKFSQKWVERIRESIMSSMPFVGSERMFHDYETRLYNPALKAQRELSANNFEHLRQMTSYRKKLAQNWEQVQFEDVDVDGLSSERITRGHSIEVAVTLKHPELQASEINVVAVLTQRVSNLREPVRSTLPLSMVKDGGASSQWKLNLRDHKPGEYSLAFRAAAKGYHHFHDSHELKLVKWL